MNETNRSIEIEVLKRKSRRKGLINELVRYVSISEESFLETDKNEEFCKKVFEKLNIFNNRIKIGGEDYKVNINLSKDYLINKLSQFTYNESAIKMLFYREYEIEAVSIPLKEVIVQIDKILEITGFSDGYADFILVEENLGFGICIEITEYYYEYVEWSND